MSTVTVVCAGNIGSHLLAHLARLPEVARVTIVDPDRYEARNLESQDIRAAEVGKPKALAQARRLRAIRPDLEVTPVAAPVEDVPLARLRADVVLACLDSKLARQRAGEAAWRLGAPLIDAGVRPDGLLVRVSVHVPGPAQSCLECAWSEADYAALEQNQPCLAGAAPAAPTQAPAALGALAAALQALAWRRLLAGDPGVAGSELVLDAASHRIYQTRLAFNPGCRFDHRTWPIERTVPRTSTLGDLLDWGALAVPGRYFATALSCSACGRRRATLRLTMPSGAVNLRCRRCKAPLWPIGLELLERLEGNLPARLRRRRLSEVGLRPGEIFQAGERFFEVV